MARAVYLGIALDLARASGMGFASLMARALPLGIALSLARAQNMGIASALAYAQLGVSPNSS